MKGEKGAEKIPGPRCELSHLKDLYHVDCGDFNVGAALGHFDCRVHVFRFDNSDPGQAVLCRSRGDAVCGDAGGGPHGHTRVDDGLAQATDPIEPFLLMRLRFVWVIKLRFTYV